MDFKRSTRFLATALMLFVLAACSSRSPGPQARFTTLKGDVISTADLRGKVVLVNFWATTCTTCVAEMPKLVDTYHKYSPRGFETVAVAMDYDTPEYVKNYAEKNALPFKVAHDASGEAAKAFEGVRLTPTSFLLDKQGRIVQKFLGEPDFNKLDETLEKLLAEAA